MTVRPRAVALAVSAVAPRRRAGQGFTTGGARLTTQAQAEDRAA